MALSEQRREEIRKGIAAYRHEQQVIRRLLKRKGSFTERDFDRWFNGREHRRRVPLRGRGISGDSFILGLGVNGMNMWAEHLELLQYMMALDIVDAKTTNGVVVYSLRDGNGA